MVASSHNKLGEFFVRWGWAWALAIVALGFALRVGGVTGFWINPDEGIYLDATRDWEGLKAVYGGNAHPPLFYVVVYVMRLLSDDFGFVRVFALVCGCASIYGMYMLGRQVAGAANGLVAALILALSPGAIEHSQIIRPYMLEIMFLVYGLAFLAKYLRSGGTRNLWVYSVAFTLAVLTHYSAFMVVGSLGITLGALLWGRGLDRRHFKPLLLASLPVLVTMALFYFLHIQPTLAGQGLQKEAQDGWLRIHMVHDVRQLWYHLIGVVRYLFGMGTPRGASSVVEGPLLVLFLAGLALAAWRRKHLVYALPLVMLVAAIGAAMAQQYPFSVTRHSMYLAPILVLPMALPIAIGLRTNWVGVAATLAVLAALALGRGPVNSALLVSRYSGDVLPERVLPTEHLPSVFPAVMEVATTGTPLIINGQTFNTLLPIFDGAQLSRAWIGDQYWFRWGRSPVLVSGSWNMTLDPNRADSMHFDLVLDEVTEALPQIGIRNRTEVMLAFTGWDWVLPPKLIELNNERPPEAQFITSYLAHPLVPFIILKIDLTKY